MYEPTWSEAKTQQEALARGQAIVWRARTDGRTQADYSAAGALVLCCALLMTVSLLAQMLAGWALLWSSTSADGIQAAPVMPIVQLARSLLHETQWTDGVEASIVVHIDARLNAVYRFRLLRDSCL
jgi:hypothetical protein